MRTPLLLCASVLFLVSLLPACGAADEQAGEAGESSGVVENGAAELAGRWAAVDGTGTLSFSEDGRVTFDYPSPAEASVQPLEGTYTPLADGKIRLDFPTFAPMFVRIVDGDEIVFNGPDEKEVTYERR